MRRIGRAVFDVLAALIVIVVAATSGSARAEEDRFAIVIGNADYALGPLANPLNDARMVAATLQDLGFEIELVENASLEAMRERIDAVLGERANADVGLLYYAGHGVQYHGVNYLLPVDIDIDAAEQLPERALPLTDILDAFGRAGVGTTVVVLDACRDNPFDEYSVFGNGLALVEEALGETIIAYAASAGAVALDGAGANSPYSIALVEALRQPGQDLYDVFRRVRGRVRELTEGKQLPWVSGSIEDRVVLNAAPAQDGEAPPNEAEVELAALADDPDWLDDTVWLTIRSGSNPSDFRLFLQHFPESRYYSAALDRMRGLERGGFKAIPVAYSPEENVASLAVDGAELRLMDPLALEITPCDVLAGSPRDPNRLVKGVPLHSLNGRAAIQACAQDLTRQPDDPRLLYQLARALILDERWREAFHYLETAASQDYPEAVNALGWFYADGLGVEQDLHRGISLWRTAARMGNPTARANLARAYKQGRGVPQSHADAVHWFELAASSGLWVAADELGNLYRNGEGVPQDYEKAIDYYRLGALLGSSNAANNLAGMYRDGLGVEQDYDEAIRWYSEALEAGNVYAPFQLGRLYAAGKGVEKDAELAIPLFELSGQRGFPEAYARAGAIYEAGDGVPVDLASAYREYLLAAESGYEPAEEMVDRVRAQLDPRVARTVEREVATWLEQNGDLVRQASYAP